MNSAIEKLRESRRVEIKVGNVTFAGRRCTMEDALKYYREGTLEIDVCRLHIDGWEGVTEKDIFGKGTEPVPFDKELFGEVISDKMEWWGPIYTGLIEDADKRAQERSKSQKK